MGQEVRESHEPDVLHSLPAPELYTTEYSRIATPTHFRLLPSRAR